MKRLRAGAYVLGNYLIRYHAWLAESWDGPRASYRPWHVFRRASQIDNRILLERFGSLQEAAAFVQEHRRRDGGS